MIRADPRDGPPGQAARGRRFTVEDVLNSRMIAYPFRLLQCCLVTDGGGKHSENCHSRMVGGQ